MTEMKTAIPKISLNTRDFPKVPLPTKCMKWPHKCFKLKGNNKLKYDETPYLRYLSRAVDLNTKLRKILSGEN
jgi:hypothetical protein